MRFWLPLVSAYWVYRCRRGNQRSGTTTVEYAILMALLVTAAVATWASFGQTLRAALQDVVNSFSEVQPQ